MGFGFVLVLVLHSPSLTQVVVSEVNIRVTNPAVLEFESDVPRASVVPLELNFLKSCSLARPGPACRGVHLPAVVSL